MENKKTKLTISGTTKKPINDKSMLTSASHTPNVEKMSM